MSLSEKYKFITSIYGSAILSRDERDMAVKCPLCAKGTSDKKKLVIRLADDVCHCWVCGFSSRSLIFLLKKTAEDRLQEYIDRFYVGPKKYIFEKSTALQERLSLPKDFTLLPLASRTNDVKACLGYLSNRGISTDDMLRFRLGCSKEQRWYKRIVFPSFDTEGDVNFFVARTVANNVFPKYDMPATDKNPIIFNELFIDWKQEVVLCEGPFDMLKCTENTVPLLGSELSENSYLFEKIVVNRTPVALALDADTRFTKTPKIARKLQEYSVRVKIIEVKTDPGDMSQQEFADAYGAAKEVSWSREMHTRLKKASILQLSL
jgi:DNA primase